MVSENGKNSLILLLMSIIWGFAFAAQRLGAGALGPFSFFAFRNYFAVIAMIVFFILFRDRKANTDLKLTIRYGLIGGLMEFVASASQQAGIAYTSTANSSFITATYVIMVPVLSLFTGRKTSGKTWFCVLLEVIGLYLLCIKESCAINIGDVLTMICALFFAIHIILIDKGGEKLDSIVFCLVQFIVCAILSTLMMFIFEYPVNVEGVRTALVPLLYTGVLSSALCVTLQVKVQKETDPTIASLIMCLESVFGALGGWLILNETLNAKELFGCLIVFVAIVISQLPDGKHELKIFSRFVK